MKRKLACLLSSIALAVPLFASQAQAAFIVETQAQTTVAAVLQEFPNPTPDNLLEIRNRVSNQKLDASQGYYLADPTMGYEVNVVRSSAPAQLSIKSIPELSWESDERTPRDTFVFQVPVGTVIYNDADNRGLTPEYLGRMTEAHELLYSNYYFDEDTESMMVHTPMPITIESTDIYEFGFVDSIYGYVYVQGIDDAGTDIPENPDDPNDNPSVSFSDVPSDAYYADPVAWAITENITNGTSATTFTPEKTCTKAEIITFLWRAAGSPEPEHSAAFSDVEESLYFAKPAAWAKENGMVSGNVFSPNAPCTRQMAVEFMWKYAGSPDAPDAAFTDISSDAVDWALETGVTTGTSATTFTPERTCTRAEIVTFLYRGFAK